jgi:CheY-like chemotaxis protein
MPAKQTVLVVDPDSDFLDWARSQLAAEDVRVLTAESSE